MEIRILYKAVGKPWQEASIANTLGAMQATVGGYIETARIAKNAPIAVRACKAAMNEGVDLNIDQAIDAEIREFSSCFASEDQKRGMAGFLNKQKSVVFENR